MLLKQAIVDLMISSNLSDFLGYQLTVMYVPGRKEPRTFSGTLEPDLVSCLVFISVTTRCTLIFGLNDDDTLTYAGLDAAGTSLSVTALA